MKAELVDFVGGKATCEFLEADVLGSAGINMFWMEVVAAVAALAVLPGGWIKSLLVVGVFGVGPVVSFGG